MAHARPNREIAISMTSSAGLELFWSVVAVGAALFGILGSAPLALSSVAAIGMAFALLARSGELATRWPKSDEVPAEREAISANLLCGFAVLALAALAIAGLMPLVLAPLALLVLAGMLVLDAPLEPALAAPRGYLAGAYMVIAGLVGILVLVAAFSVREHELSLVPWAALIVASAHAVAAVTVLRRFAGKAAEV